MGSGEDSVHHLKVHLDETTSAISSTTYDTVTQGNTSNNLAYYNNWPYSWYINYPSVIYKYEVKCPQRGCKSRNWLELDTTTPCTKCGAKLRAVADVPDFTIPISK